MGGPGPRRPYTTTEDPAKYREWDRTQWPGEEAEGTPGGEDESGSAPGDSEAGGEAPGTPASASEEARWNKAEYVGENADGQRPEPQAPRDMTEGEHGRSGHRHTDEAAHWARPADEKDATRDEPA